MKGINAIVAMTILMITSPALGEKGGKAQTSPPDKGGIQNAITHNAPTSDHQRTRSARSKGGRLTPMDHLLLESYANRFKGQGEQGGTLVGQGYDYHRLPFPAWPAAQRDPRVTRRYHRVPPNPVGNQIRVRTTFHSDGTRQIEIRDVFGRPVNWDLEANPQAAYGLLASD